MKKTKNLSASSQNPSKPTQGNVNNNSAKHIRKLRKKQAGLDLVPQLLKGDKTALGKAITYIESYKTAHQKVASAILEAALPSSGNSIRIGITGVPGVGKSTFIESLGNFLIRSGKRVAVLAVDPSSSISKGSILGDKTRMPDLVKQEAAFIRPSASGDTLGGVARKTRESIILCEAAGFDVILIETVGVGQSETSVHSMTDFFLLLKLAGAGDELQGIKRGIIEMADAIIINKADGDNLKAAQNAKLEFKRALQLYPPKENLWMPRVLLSSALYNEGTEKVWKMITDFITQTKANDYFKQHRDSQNEYWLLQTINEELKQSFYQNPEIKEAFKEQLQAILDKRTTAHLAAKQLLAHYHKL